MFFYELAELLLELGFEALVEAARNGEPKAKGFGLV
jgi:hypothetical protein